MLKLEDVCASYGAVHALENVSLAVGKGQAVALLGANGAGKTTTLNCVSGVVPVLSGRIWFEDEEITNWAPERIVARGVVQVPEGREIFPAMSVLDNLELGLWTRRRTRDAAQDLERVYHYFPRLKERARQMAGTLSGGEQQMLMIGRALMARPSVLMLDEPSLGLSPILVTLIFDIIRKLNQEGISILIVEQNALVALSSSEYGYILENGEVRLHGKSSALLRDPDVKAAYLGAETEKPETHRQKSAS